VSLKSAAGQDDIVNEPSECKPYLEQWTVMAFSFCINPVLFLSDMASM